MATRALAQTLCYIAWNTNTNGYQTGDASNHTLYWSKDGSSNAANGTATEVDSTHLPGVYSCAMLSTETDCKQGVLGGKSSTSNVILVPTMVAFDYLNTSAPATAGIPDVNIVNVAGTASAGAAGYVGIDWSKVTNPTSTVGLSATTISISQAIASVSGAVGSVTGAVGSISGITFPANFGSFSIASGGYASCNVTYVNGTPVAGNGSSGSPWGPA